MKPYRPRPTRYLGSLSHEGWDIKQYSVVYDASVPFDAARFDAGVPLALAELPRPARAHDRPGVAILIRHQAEGMDYLVLAWWDRENELPIKVFVREASEPEWRRARGGESVCVWDLDVLWQERQAYVATLLGPEPAGARERYLERSGGTG
ncbi:MAG TPA: hypothetical protein VLE53_02445 [Gemmatimonadaceae bacterium]|nr:hypothetical protein [Gemmatimonadaceae bacterium]